MKSTIKVAVEAQASDPTCRFTPVRRTGRPSAASAASLAARRTARSAADTAICRADASCDGRAAAGRAGAGRAAAGAGAGAVRGRQGKAMERRTPCVAWPASGPGREAF